MDNTKDLLSVYRTDYMSGSLVFSGEYVSKAQLVKVVEKFVKEDDAWLHAVVRNSGNDIALDFMYKADKIKREDRNAEFKEMFEKELGGDYLNRWGYSDPAYVIKQ